MDDDDGEMMKPRTPMQSCLRRVPPLDFLATPATMSVPPQPSPEPARRHSHPGHHPTRRRFAAATFASALGLGLGGLPNLLRAADPKAKTAASGWEVVKHEGLEYVTATSVHAFYRFQTFTRQDKDALFRSTNTLMKWQVDSPYIFINNIKFCLSFPVLQVGDKLLISRVDLQKLMDPVLRPWYIQNTQQFNTVIIDAGHGGHDNGAIGTAGNEKDFALEMARALRDEIQGRGLQTKMTRDSDVFLSLGERVRFANKVDKSIFVSVHFNSGDNSEANGIETYALAPQGTVSTNDGSYSVNASNGNQRDGENIALATAVHAMVMSKITAFDRGVKRARYNVLVGIEHPAILFEGGFVTNAAEGKKCATASYRGEVAKAIADGVVNFRNALKK